ATIEMAADEVYQYPLHRSLLRLEIPCQRIADAPRRADQVVVVFVSHDAQIKCGPVVLRPVTVLRRLDGILSAVVGLCGVLAAVRVSLADEIATAVHALAVDIGVGSLDGAEIVIPQ